MGHLCEPCVLQPTIHRSQTTVFMGHLCENARSTTHIQHLFQGGLGVLEELACPYRAIFSGRSTTRAPPFATMEQPVRGGLTYWTVRGDWPSQLASNREQVLSAANGNLELVRRARSGDKGRFSLQHSAISPSPTTNSLQATGNSLRPQHLGGLTAVGEAVEEVCGFVHRFLELLGSEGLGEIAVHAGGDTSILVSLHGICG